LSEFCPDPDLAKVEATAPRDREIETVPSGSALGRIHSKAGPYPSEWYEFRHFGPTRSRFDHHACDPPALDPDRGVMYATVGSNSFPGAIAEYFQDSTSQSMGPIDRVRGTPTYTRFDLIGDLRLLDLNGAWITRAGGNQAIRTGSRSVAQRWSRAIYEAFAVPHDLHGLRYDSSIWGPGQCVVLWERAEIALPEFPVVTIALGDSMMDVAIASAARHLGTVIAR
jgi:hypothetical protein